MAYECSPYRGSECAVGWGRLLGAAKMGETHVVTSKENFAALQQAQKEGLLPANVSFHTPAPDLRLRKLQGKPALFAYNYRAYHYWQRLAFRLVEELHRRERFDIVHQISVCTFREPGYGWKLDVPFVWGPVGGTQNFPARFLSMLEPAEAVKEGLRSVGNWCALRKRRVRRAARNSALVIAANGRNQVDLGRALRREVEVLLETGLHEIPKSNHTRFETRLAHRRAGRTLSPLRILWSGELQTRKALPVLLESLAKLPPATAWQLDVIGDGPRRRAWEKQAHGLGIADRVRFVGRLPFADAVECMKSAELLCFTSLRDTSGNVMLEALAAGVPVLCFDHQGAREIVNQHSGIKLPVSRPQRAYHDWAQAIETLANDPRKLLALSRGASEHAQQFLWTRNHARMNDAYETLVLRHHGQTKGVIPGVDEIILNGTTNVVHAGLS